MPVGMRGGGGGGQKKETSSGHFLAKSDLNAAGLNQNVLGA